MSRKYFEAKEVIKEISGHVASSQIFADNGIRIYVKTKVSRGFIGADWEIPVSWFEVEVIHDENKVHTFDTLKEALEFGEQNQKVR